MPTSDTLFTIAVTAVLTRDIRVGRRYVSSCASGTHPRAAPVRMPQPGLSQTPSLQHKLYYVVENVLVRTIWRYAGVCYFNQSDRRFAATLALVWYRAYPVYCMLVTAGS